jgi:hypothetical protein
MTVRLGTVVFLALFVAHSSSAQSAQPRKTSARIIRSFFIEPTSTSIEGGKASLIVGALHRMKPKDRTRTEIQGFKGRLFSIAPNET